MLYKACKLGSAMEMSNILESASSWSEERSKAIDAESPVKIIDSLPFRNPPVNTNFVTLSTYFPLSIESSYKKSAIFSLFLGFGNI